MDHLFKVVMLGSVVFVQGQISGAKPEQSANPHNELMSENTSHESIALPAMPRGMSTVLGGQLRDIDLVRDEFSLKVFGQRTMKIRFDARTLVYLDGKSVSLRNLRSGDHASVQTVLNGTDVFAISIRMLSHSPEGVYQAQVVSYNHDSGELILKGAMSRDPIKLRVPANTPVTQIKQKSIFSQITGLPDIVKGSLISVNFQSDKEGHGVASKIEIIATPGSVFMFSGNLASLDLHSGLLVLIDAQSDNSYQVSFDPAHFPASRILHEGDFIQVTAIYDGAHYTASAILTD
jgi:hypothetical protein